MVLGNKNRKAFTLAEMMVVILILSIVLAVSMPVITKRSRNTATGVPTGTIVAFGGATAPMGWLLCNGQSTAGNPALATVVSANVPDLRGEFIRGLDSGRGLDPQANRTLNFAPQTDAIQNKLEDSKLQEDLVG